MLQNPIVVSVVQHFPGPKSGRKWGVWTKKISRRLWWRKKTSKKRIVSCKISMHEICLPIHGTLGEILIKTSRHKTIMLWKMPQKGSFWGSGGFRRLNVGGKSLTLGSVCSRILLLFCCYCSTLQHCSVPNVRVLYLWATFSKIAQAGWRWRRTRPMIFESLHETEIHHAHISKNNLDQLKWIAPHSSFAFYLRVIPRC